MSLSVSIASSAVSKKATSITLKDTTGSYSSPENTGGYGVENDFLAPSISMLFWRYWSDEDYTQYFLGEAKETALLSNSGVDIAPSQVGSTDTSFKDGVHQVKYVPLNDAEVTATLTNGSKLVALSPADFDAVAFGSTLVAYIVVATDGDPSTPLSAALEIDWTETQSTTQLVLKEAYDGDTVSGELWFGPIIDFKVLVNKGADACIASTVGKIAQTQCVCQKERQLINQFIQWRFAADVQFECDDFDGAQNLLTQINRYCTSAQCLIC